MRLAVGVSRSSSTTTSPLARARTRPRPGRSAVVASTSTQFPSGPQASVSIGKSWREYQGANNWDGLLDPLDDALRSEILRYGEFARAAYTCFDFNPSSPSYGTCQFPKRSLLRSAGLPDTGYHITRNLTATSGARLPGWAEPGTPEWLSRCTSWIGYVAVCQDEDEIERLGRRDIVISYRGTATCLEWVENLRATLTHLPGAALGSAGTVEPMVERGFWSLFTSSAIPDRRSLRDQVREEVRRLIDLYGGRGSSGEPPLSLTVTGHSLGAALAVLTAHDITMAFEDAPMVTVVSFGGPRVGNASFRRGLEQSGTKVLRIVNTQDIVTKLPGFVVEDRSLADDDEGWLPSWMLSKMGWAYADIGRELRLSGQKSANVVACHDLSVYLNLVNQLSSNCPLRTLAMRSSST